jgi:16S rRNA processing protein RimM
MVGAGRRAVAVSPAAPAPLPAGRVGRAHGLDGSFYVTESRPRLLVVGTRVTVAGQTRTIVRHAGVQRKPIVRLEGIADRDAARALHGQTLMVAAGQEPTLAEGEWWAHQLEGCMVFDGELSVGTVSTLLELPSCEVLEVLREDGRELLVPMVKDAIRRVDVSARRIDIDLDFLGETKIGPG